MKKFALPFILLISLSACGGSGGGSSASSATNWTSTKCTSSYTNSDDINVPCAYQSFNTTQNGTTGSYNSSTYDSLATLDDGSCLYQVTFNLDLGLLCNWSSAFGTDIPDLYRSLICSGKILNKKIYQRELKNKLLNLVDDLQKVLDKKKLCSEAHIIFEKK